MFKLHVGYLLFHLVRVVASASAAALLRRHLMVWKIFAPRFIFDAVFCVSISLVGVVAFAFVLRVDVGAAAIVAEVKRWSRRAGDERASAAAEAPTHL